MIKSFPKFSYAFQPIVDISTQAVFSYEALIRGTQNESASSILSQIAADDKVEFDQLARNYALKLASALRITCYINLNFIPECLLYTDKYILATLEAVRAVDLSPSQLVVEVTEGEIIHNPALFAKHIDQFKGLGIKLAIDDFGAGYSGLNLLVDFLPDMIKLDMQLIRDIHSRGPRQAVVKALIQVCTSLGIDLIAEGVETVAEYNWLKAHDVTLIQGFLLAEPGFETLPAVTFPNV